MQLGTHFKRLARTSRGVVSLHALLIIAACSDAPALTEPIVTPEPVPSVPSNNSPLVVSGYMTQQDHAFTISRGGKAVIGANVIVNGFRVQHSNGSNYSGSLPEAVPVGGTLHLRVEDVGVNFEAVGEVIAAPTITAPTAEATFSRTDTVSLSWSSPSDPDRFEVCLNCSNSWSEGPSYFASGSVRKLNLVPGVLVEYGDNALVTVTALKDNFLKSASSEVITNVRFMAPSADARITINR